MPRLQLAHDQRMEMPTVPSLGLQFLPVPRGDLSVSGGRHSAYPCHTTVATWAKVAKEAVVHAAFQRDG